MPAPAAPKVISVRGARTHNLRSIDVDIPRERLVVLTGLSGSGKSSLAFDTIYAEGQRRYVESLSTYARQFLSVMDKPDVDHIEGLSPAIAIEQRSTAHNPRSTVGTITEIYDYLRLLWARVGEPRCPEHGTVLRAETVSEMVDAVLALPEGTRVMVLAPVVRRRRGEQRKLLDTLRAQGYVRVRVDGIVRPLDELEALGGDTHHDLDVVVDRLRVRPDARLRLTESVETALGLAEGLAIVAPLEGGGEEASGVRERLFSATWSCPECGFTLPELEPRLFSFNNPVGACPGCDGLGVSSFFDPARIVRRPELSLAAGAVSGWDRRNAYWFQMLESLAAHYGFDLDQPFESLPEEIREILLHGSGEESVRFTFHGERGGRYVREHPFEGIIPSMERRYRETESQVVREELGRHIATRPCPECGGTRLNRFARSVFVGGYSLPELVRLSIAQARSVLATLELEGHRAAIAGRILRELGERLGFLMDVGLEYLTLDRPADTLSGGEGQRIRLASQIGAGLAGVMYVLDEPSVGLHPRDNARLLASLLRLRDLGNSVLVVEHDEETIRAADHVIDIGPGAGVHGGRIVATGTAEQISAEPASLTGQYLAGHRRVPVPERRRPVGAATPRLVLRGATGHNLQGVTLELPLGVLTCVTGVSGSGKSTLVTDTLQRAVVRALGGGGPEPEPFEALEGVEQVDKVVDIDQSPIGRTPRSNPATYTGLFAPIRELFAGTPEARSRGYGPGRFSFNVKGGRCEACRGDGLIRVEMHFLPDVFVPCDVCGGKRYNRETLEIRYRGRSIDEVLALTVEEARRFFDAIPALVRKLDTLLEVGLGYLELGQSATTLSGGEAQRLKLARELSRRDTGRTLYLLDEPTTGLHFHDVEQLLRVLQRLVDQGNTVVIIEHNLEVVKGADWVVDLGPEGGAGGGHIVAAGTPEALTRVTESRTGRYLARVLERDGVPLGECCPREGTG